MKVLGDNDSDAESYRAFNEIVLKFKNTKV